MRKTWRWHAATATATATPASAYPAVPLAAASTASAPSLTPASSTTSASSAAASVVLPPANGVKINLIECEMKFVLTHTHSSTHTQTHTAVHTHLQQYSHTHTAATGAALHPQKLSLSLSPHCCAFLSYCFSQFTSTRQEIPVTQHLLPLSLPLPSLCFAFD